MQDLAHARADGESDLPLRTIGAILISQLRQQFLLVAGRIAAIVKAGHSLFQSKDEPEGSEG